MITLIQIGDRYVIPDKKTFLIDSEADIVELETEAEDSAPATIGAAIEVPVISSYPEVSVLVLYILEPGAARCTVVAP